MEDEKLYALIVSHKELLVHLHWSWGGVRHVTAGEVGDAHKLFKSVPTLRLKEPSCAAEEGAHG